MRSLPDIAGHAAALHPPCKVLLCALFVAALVAVVLLPAPSVEAQVEIIQRPDGTREVRNVGTASDAAKRHASQARSLKASSRKTPAQPTWRAAPRPELEKMVAVHAANHGLDARLVQAVIQAESAWERRALSHVGAMGLMQIMPATAVDLALLNPWEETENVRAGTAYLAQQVKRFGSLELALAAYNAGPGAVTRHGGIPPFAETREYVRRILCLYRNRTVTAAELAPFWGRGGSLKSGGGPAPGFTRNAEGRLVLTNTASTTKPTKGGARSVASSAAAARVPAPRQRPGATFAADRKPR